jgi:hypothetical protein
MRCIDCLLYIYIVPVIQVIKVLVISFDLTFILQEQMNEAAYTECLLGR